MLIIDSSYFTGELNIPQLPTSRVEDDWATFGVAKVIQATAENNLLVFIDTKVTEYLYKLLGDEFAEDFIEMWQKVEDGVQVDDDDTFKLIDKLKYKMGSVKVSPLANYVWYWLNRDAYNGTTAMGEADLNFARATNAYEADKFLKMTSMRNKLVRANNDMVLKQQRAMRFIRNSKELNQKYAIPYRNWHLLNSTQNNFNL